ncbi:baseplate wedge subunit [Escherichia phage FP43]|uniref:Baseplate wedge subunit n=1 Tax=Escherichia phage FP43 TaxID=2666261 RepID=A0A650EZ80_9CAUD|nr:baseplate wedge subunit [Escherichia phage FP43]
MTLQVSRVVIILFCFNIRVIWIFLSF